MKNHLVILCIGGLLAIILAGCGSSTPEPTPQATTDAMKANIAKHEAAMAAAAKQHAAEPAARDNRRDDRGRRDDRR